MNSGWFLKRENLPVQVPTKYELVINIKTAKTLGIADEVIE